MGLCSLEAVPEGERDSTDLLSEFGTIKTVKALLGPWLEPFFG